jgi:hypothetical protein
VSLAYSACEYRIMLTGCKREEEGNEKQNKNTKMEKRRRSG